MFEVIFYETSNGTCPIDIFLNELPVKTKARVFQVIRLLEIRGNELKMPFSKPLDDKIFELRIQQNEHRVRILYFFVIGKKVILTNGFLKDSQRTPSSEITKAKNSRDDYLIRMGD